MGLIIGNAVIIARGRRLATGGGTPQTFYLLTPSRDNLCTAGGNRLVWRNLKRR